MRQILGNVTPPEFIPPTRERVHFAFYILHFAFCISQPAMEKVKMQNAKCKMQNGTTPFHPAPRARRTEAGHV
jgi:hypothetical protein